MTEQPDVDPQALERVQDERWAQHPPDAPETAPSDDDSPDTELDSDTEPHGDTGDQADAPGDPDIDRPPMS